MILLRFYLTHKIENKSLRNPIQFTIHIHTCHSHNVHQSSHALRVDITEVIILGECVGDVKVGVSNLGDAIMMLSATSTAFLTCLVHNSES